jgi:hypothetical protein
MGLVLSLTKDLEDSLLTKLALSIALESYRDLENSFGYALRKENLIDTQKVINLVNHISDTKEGDDMLFNLDNALLLVTAFDITLKSITSNEPYRFFHAFANNPQKRDHLRKALIKQCKEMLTELSEQAIYRYEIEQQKILMSNFIYD